VTSGASVTEPPIATLFRRTSRNREPWNSKVMIPSSPAVRYHRDAVRIIDAGRYGATSAENVYIGPEMEL